MQKISPFVRSLIPIGFMALLVYFFVFDTTGCASQICEFADRLRETFGGYYNLYSTKIGVLLGLFVFFVLFSNIVITGFMGRILEKVSTEEKSLWVLRLSRVVWWFVFVVVSISILFENVTGLLTSIGLIGFAVTFALQKPILNFVGWMTITLKGLYKEGDRIEIGMTRGDVKDIQIMNTIVESLTDNTDTASKKYVSVPNELVLTSEVRNYAKETNYIRERVTVGVQYEDDYRKAISILEKIVIEYVRDNLDKYTTEAKKQQQKIEDLLAKFTRSKKQSNLTGEHEQEHSAAERPIVDEFLPKTRVELGPSSIDISVLYMVPYFDAKKSKSQITLAFLDSIAKEKSITIAYPHIHLHYPNESSRYKRGARKQ